MRSIKVRQFVVALSLPVVLVTGIASSQSIDPQTDAAYPNAGKCYAGGANPVYGTCENGKFTGYFSQTGKPVYGKCVIGGALKAYDPETGKPIYGKC